MVDNSDAQYASFRDNVPYLLIVLILHPPLRKAFEFIYKPDSSLSRKTPHERLAPSDHTSADDRKLQRLLFDLGFGILFIMALHGFSAVKILIILYINYNIATQLRREYVPAVTWIFNIGILFANELGKGYPYSTIANAVSPWSATPEGRKEQELLANWGTVLDNYGGLIPRWEILFNVTILRLISFNLDYYWSLSRPGGSPIEVCGFESSPLIPLIPLQSILTATRRNSSILQICQKEIGWTYQLSLRTIPFAIISHMSFIHHCTLRVLS